ncbi:BnaCnng22180D [Brassica napus]|uniref:BnaCnng22180D protein n=1 Tax=Brassica napus TaxID=3708 RepID=A0A078IQY7_BRANA|nr:BnaCnng22180D [Brassica napus]
MASPVVRTHQKSVNSPALVAATTGLWMRSLVVQMLRLRGRRRLRLRKKLLRIRKKRLKLRKKTVEANKKEAELKKKQEAELKKQKQAGSKYKKVTPPRDGVTRCKVQPDVEDSSLADITDEVVAEQNEFAPESDVENSEVFVECLALGVTFDGINDQNIQGLRMKMAANILAEEGNVVTDQMMAN